MDRLICLPAITPDTELNRHHSTYRDTLRCIIFNETNYSTVRTGLAHQDRFVRSKIQINQTRASSDYMFRTGKQVEHFRHRMIQTPVGPVPRRAADRPCSRPIMHQELERILVNSRRSEIARMKMNLEPRNRSIPEANNGRLMLRQYVIQPNYINWCDMKGFGLDLQILDNGSAEKWHLCFNNFPII